MSRSNPAQRPWKSILSFVFALGIGLAAVPSAQACLLDSDGLDCSFSLRKAETRSVASVAPPAGAQAAQTPGGTERWSAEGELNTLPILDMPNQIDEGGVGASFGLIDSASGAFLELDRVDFTAEECVARGGNYRRVRCKNDGGLIVLSPRSALSFFKVIARMNKRSFLFPTIADVPLAVVLHSPEGENRGDTIGSDPNECKYTASKQKKLTCKRLP